MVVILFMLVRFGRFVAVWAQKPFDDIKTDDTQSRPPAERSAGQFRAFGKHVKTRGAQHRSGRQTQVDLQGQMGNPFGQRKASAKNGDGRDGQALQKDGHGKLSEPTRPNPNCATGHRRSRVLTANLSALHSGRALFSEQDTRCLFPFPVRRGRVCTPP